MANLKSKLLACFALLTMLVGQAAAVDMQNCQMHMSSSLTADTPTKSIPYSKHQVSEYQGHGHTIHAGHDMQMMKDAHQGMDSSAHDCCKTAKAECQCPHQICHNTGIVLNELAISQLVAMPNKITNSINHFISQPSASLYRPPIT
ncbi:hypothetical protein [Catenovulum agarivorans]|uniref:hypothetical protein n=1 Tax=Catenovulum agarivorans TaxID=1172192 RepID=UPI001268E669|nr:hypothetical protein [Catenovulum agarivorans]